MTREAGPPRGEVGFLLSESASLAKARWGHRPQSGAAREPHSDPMFSDQHQPWTSASIA